MASDVFTGAFWKDAADRAISAGATAAVAVWGLGGVDIIPVVPWYSVLVTFGGAAALDVLRSLSSLTRSTGTASHFETTQPAPELRHREDPS